jgi:hypothetical protein
MKAGEKDIKCNFAYMRKDLIKMLTAISESAAL